MAMTSRRRCIALTLTLLASAACAPRKPAGGTTASAAPAAKDPVYEKEIRDWHTRRVERLQQPGGWLTLVGLYWLKEGGNRVGSGSHLEIVLPRSAPSEVGTLMLSGGEVSFSAAPGVTPMCNDNPVIRMDRVRTDKSEKPDKIEIGTVTFHVIERGKRIGVRVTDTNAPAKKAFKGIDTYPVEARWRVQAKWVAYDKPQEVEIATVIPGLVEKYPVPGEAVFTVDGKELKLRPVIEPGETDLFFIFGDETNGPETYGAGRFLYAKPPKDGVVTIDFNMAYSPPCAFTPYATCPLPPDENRLPVRVTAGEKKYDGGHS